MALNFGTGLGLSTNPRDQSTRATGGSIKAGQYKDSSSIITGNPQDSIGFSSPKNVLTNPSDPVAPTAAPDLNYKPKTSSEWITQNKESGIADTHANMGSLAMGFRESEAALSAAGKPTVIEARDTEILRSRAAEEHKRLITEPAAAEALKFRSQAAAAKNMFKSRFTSSLQGGRSQGGSYDFNNAGGGGSRGIPTISTPKSFSATATPSNTHGVSAYMNTRQQREAPYLERIDKAPTDNLIGAIKAHSAAPGTNVVTAEEAANKASAENRATPTEMIQARMSAEARKRPNK